MTHVPRTTVGPTGRAGSRAGAIVLAAFLLAGLATSFGLAFAPARGVGVGPVVPPPAPLGASTSVPVEVSGTILDSYSGSPLSGTTIRIYATGSALWHNQTTDRDGRFSLRVEPGLAYVTVDPPAGYDGVALHLTVGSGGISGLRIGLTPSALLHRVSGSAGAVGAAAVLAALGGALVAAGAVASRRRREAGHGSQVLSRFGAFVLSRILLIPLQLVAILVVLYAFGSFLPVVELAQHTGCLTTPNGGCAPCPASSFSCQISVFGAGFWDFLSSIVLGQWGFANIGALRLPVVDFLHWWLPNSLELAGVALALSVAIGYPLGIAAGWRTGRVLDRGLRAVSLTMLLLPTFLVVLFILLAAYEPWLAKFGDPPYGLLPSATWFLANGGFPSWLGFAGQTTPTGIPLVDGAIHGAWPFVIVVGAKLLLQAFAIALIYVAIFLRYARHAVADAARSESIRAARSRGVPESTLEWRHTARRTLPVYLLVFGMTLPAYIGTQAVVEVLFGDTQGIGTILFAEMTQIGHAGFGFLHHGPVALGNLYQITIFFLVLFLLVANLCADILARYLDPTLGSGEPR